MAAPRKVMAMLGAIAVAGGLSAGAVALAGNTSPSTPSPRVTATSNDDGTLDQGPGDAPGTPGAAEDGQHQKNDDGTPDQGPGDVNEHENEGPSSNSGPSENSGPGSVRDDDGDDQAEDHSGRDGGSAGSDDGTPDQGHGDA